MRIDRCCVVITGAASGLGRAAAAMFCKDGASVALLDKDAQGLESTLTYLNAQGLQGRLLAIQADVADPSTVHSAVEEVRKTFGSIHVCVNSAALPLTGRIYSRSGPLPLEEFRKVIQVNLIGAFDVARLSIERMVINEPDEDGERGVVINVASGAAWQGQSGQVAYSASKAALIGLSLPMARDLAHFGIRVIAVAPGFMDTPPAAKLPEHVRKILKDSLLYPNRLGTPSEFAELVRQTVVNSYINATTLSIDGGLRLG